MWRWMMHAVPAGSTPWLLAHEMRLVLRGKWTRNKFIPWILIALFVGIAMMSGVPLAKAFPGRVVFSPLFSAAVFIGCLFLFAISVSQALTMTIQLFFERGDFDLLLSSPVPPSRVLFVRLLTIAFSPFLYFGAFLTCVLLPMMIFDDPRLFGAYGVLAVVCLFSALAAVSLGMGLYRWLGPRRTRTVGHLLAIVFAMIFIVCAQVPQYFEYHPLAGDARTVVHTQLMYWFAPGSPLSWPGQAALGSPWALAGLLLFAVLAFWLMTERLGHSFAGMAATSQGSDAPRRAKHTDRPLSGFTGSPLWVMVRKEWRQLIRDPMLLSQVLMQGLIVLPMVFGMYFGASAADAEAGAHSVVQMHAISMISMAISLIFVTAMISGALVEIIVMGEDGPDLLASAPMTQDRIRFAKLFAALFPVGVLALILGIGLVIADPWTGCVALVMCFLAAYSVCYITFWYEKPQPQKNFRRRHVDGALITRLSKLFLSFCFMPATALAVLQSLWALAFMVLPVAFLGILYACRRYDV